MTERPLVAVYGATGAVGRATVAGLVAAGLRLRLGGRCADRLDAVPGDAQRVVLPAVGEPGSSAALARFCAGATLVVNCAGPSGLIGDAVLRAALAAGADHVDPGGDGLVRWPPAGRCRVVLGAGLSPGLTGLLPRHLAAGVPGVRRLRGWCGGLDRFTEAAAADMVDSLAGEYGTALAAIQHGTVVRQALEPEHEVRLPGFPDLVTAYPFLPVEAQRTARDTGVAELQWFNVFAGARVLAVLTRHGSAAELVAAAQADLAGREPHQVLVVEATGAGPHDRTLVLCGRDGYQLTAAVVVAAALAVLDRWVPPGVHLAAEVLDPVSVLRHLRGLATYTVLEGPALVEEGAL